ncbi:MAG: hypothetical protein AAFO07_28195, partial [Bacteroidota bacterium]
MRNCTRYCKAVFMTLFSLGLFVALFFPSAANATPDGKSYYQPVTAPVINIPSNRLSEFGDTLFVTCLDGFVFSDSLQVTDDNDPAYPRRVGPILSKDSTLIAANFCMGDTITRRWVANDVVDMLTSVKEQVVIFKDTILPTVSIEEIHDTIPRDWRFNAIYDFNPWVDAITFDLQINWVSDNCSGVPTVRVDSIGPSGTLNACETRVVKYSIEDACGNITYWRASLT